MNKEELIEAIQNKLGADTSKRAASDALNAVLDSIMEGVKDSTVTLTGFGNFVKQERPARQGRNPKTGEALEIKASTVVRFRPAITWKRMFEQK